MAQSLIFENPSKLVRATVPVNITWDPKTFGSGSGSFNLNLWLLRTDSSENDLINRYLPQVLARDHDVFQSVVVWIPTLDDVTVDVPQLGSDQLAWEKSDDNSDLSPYATKFRGFSRGFIVQRPLPDPSSSSNQSSTTPSINSTPAPNPAVGLDPSTSDIAETSTNNMPVIIGLSVALGLLSLICIGAAIWGVREYRDLKVKAEAAQLQAEQMPPKPKYELEDSNALDTNQKLKSGRSEALGTIEMSSERYSR